MITFKVKNISGGRCDQPLMVRARDLRELAAELEARVVSYCCNWALLQNDGATSWEVTWTDADRRAEVAK